MNDTINNLFAFRIENLATLSSWEPGALKYTVADRGLAGSRVSIFNYSWPWSIRVENCKFMTPPEGI